LRKSTPTACENPGCGVRPAVRFFECKTRQERRLRRRRLCERCRWRWIRYERLELLPPTVNQAQEAAIAKLHGQGHGASYIGRQLGLERMRVHRRIVKIRERAR